MNESYQTRVSDRVIAIGI